MNPDKVEELFDYCQILEAYITKSGWKFLIEYYGIKKLYEIDKKSGWLSDICPTNSYLNHNKIIAQYPNI